MLGAVEMCNNNGACRSFDAGVMCPSYRATRDEAHLTRGPRQHAAPGAHRPARPRRHGLRRRRRRHETLRLLQSLPARMPDRRRHGEDENRGAGGARRPPWRRAARADGCRTAAHRPVRRPRCRRSPTRLQRSQRHCARALPPERSLPALRGDAFGDPEAARPAGNVVCSPTASTGISSPKTCAPRCACCAPPVFPRGLPAAAPARCAAAGPTSPPAWWGARATKRAARSRPCAATPPVVGLEPSCLFTLKDEFPSLLPGAEARALADRAFFSASSSPRAARCRSDRCRAPRTCTATATRKALARSRRPRRPAAGARAAPSIRSPRPAAAWPAHSATRPKRRTISRAMAEAGLLPAIRAAGRRRPDRRRRHLLPPADPRPRRPAAVHSVRVLDMAMTSPTPPDGGA